MEVRYYAEALLSHLDPQVSKDRKFVDRVVSRLAGKRSSSALKARNLNTNLVCMTTLDEIYIGLIEKYATQSDMWRAGELKRIYDLLRPVDFDKFMKSGDSKSRLLYFLYKLSVGSSSFYSKQGAEPTNADEVARFSEEDPANATVCLVDWDSVLFEGEEFFVRKFDGNDDFDESLNEDHHAPSPEKEADSEEPYVAQDQATPATPIDDVIKKPTVLENLSLLAGASLLTEYQPLRANMLTEFSVCNNVLCALSGMKTSDCLLNINSESLLLTHLSLGAVNSAVCQISNPISSVLQDLKDLYGQVSSFSEHFEHVADIGIACGQFLDFVSDFMKEFSRQLVPVTLINIDTETAEIRRLMLSVGCTLKSASNEPATFFDAPGKTAALVNIALSLQKRLHFALVGCDNLCSGWLVLFWISTVRPLLRAIIKTTFKQNESSEEFSWFSSSILESDIVIGELNLRNISKVLKTAHRYLTFLRQCREEVGDFMAQSKIFALPNLLEDIFSEIIRDTKFSPNQVVSSRLLCPLLPSYYPHSLPIDVVDEISRHWTGRLESYCKTASSQLYYIWEATGVHAWLLGVRLVFLCQSVIQFDGRNKFLKTVSPALELLALNFPRDVWLEFVPSHIRNSMLNSCSYQDVSSGDPIDCDGLTGNLANCKSVAQALELMESSSNEQYPLVLFPVSLFLSPDVLTKYVRVHSFLVAFHVSKNWLSRALLSNDPQSSCHGKFAIVRSTLRTSRTSTSHCLLTPADRLLWLLRSAVFFALSALQQYFFTSVVCANCQRLGKKLEEVESADDLERIHDEMLSSIVAGCLFPVGHRTYQASLRHLIVLADLLSRQQVVPKTVAKNMPFYSKQQASCTNVSQCSDDSILNMTQVDTDTSWKLLATDTYQGIRFLADTLSRSASKNHSVNRSTLNSSLLDSEYSSSSVAWLATELQHASDIVSKQSQVLLLLMHSR